MVNKNIEMDWQRDLLPYAQAVDELVVKFEGIKRDFERLNKPSPIQQVLGRVKRVSSIIEKANRRSIPVDQALNKLEDIAGVRIICRFVSDIEQVVSLIKARSDYDMKIVEEEDYITNVKPSGYRSYHITVKYPIFSEGSIKDVICELQIRTMSMNFWATIEHSLRYKYDGKIPDDLKARLQRSAEAAFQLDREMDLIRNEMFEAMKTIQTNESITEKIIANIHKLCDVPDFDKVGEYNNEFITLYREGRLQKLVEFNNNLESLVEMYSQNND
ncbi:MAG TPA: GTP pyrophosphokinase [Lachnospiraceae bacterium]|nr:GTP pyrophosphokinase [Lachnospiraceae bacterium]